MKKKKKVTKNASKHMKKKNAASKPKKGLSVNVSGHKITIPAQQRSQAVRAAVASALTLERGAAVQQIATGCKGCPDVKSVKQKQAKKNAAAAAAAAAKK